MDLYLARYALIVDLINGQLRYDIKSRPPVATDASQKSYITASTITFAIDLVSYRCFLLLCQGAS